MGCHCRVQTPGTNVWLHDDIYGKFLSLPQSNLQLSLEEVLSFPVKIRKTY